MYNDFYKSVELYLQVSYGKSIYRLTGITRKQWSYFEDSNTLPLALYIRICELVGISHTQPISIAKQVIDMRCREELEEYESQGHYDMNIISYLAKYKEIV